EIGESTILKAASNVSHHVKIGRLCYLSVESVVGAYVQVGKCSDISMGAKVLEKRKVGEYAIAGAASLVTKDIGDMEIHIGIPAKFFKKIDN
ncbi:MAG: sugar O-acyltransferase, partial [Bacteroidota bacterium]|nr:sugar O-acyltransferase [Bacteroidota bacterium]